MSEERSKEVYLVTLAEPNAKTVSRVKSLWPEHYVLGSHAILIVSEPSKGHTVGWAKDIYARLSNNDKNPVSCLISEVHDNWGYFSGSLWSWLSKVGR